MPGLPAANPASWTSFANLLFVDERQSGFSYELDDGATPIDAAACVFTPVGDAADFVRVVLGVLDARPAIRAAPVILVGQSYGGERATLVLDLLLRYSTEAPQADAALLETIQAHYDAVFPQHAGTIIASSLVRTQFGRVVLLQPLLLGKLQYTVQAPLIRSDPYVGDAGGHDPYDVRQPKGWSQAVDDTPTVALADFARAASLLALDPRGVSGMGPGTRASAFRPAPFLDAGRDDLAQVETNAAWEAGLGSLEPVDQYLVCPATACPVDEDSMTLGPGSTDAFLANLRAGVRTFISHARYDSVIDAAAIPAALATVATVAIDTTPRPGVARPGWFTVAFPEDGGAAPPIEVRFPPYDASGHYISIGQPQALHDDVAAWMFDTP